MKFEVYDPTTGIVLARFSFLSQAEKLVRLTRPTLTVRPVVDPARRDALGLAETTFRKGARP